MIRSLWIAKTGLDAQQTNLDVIANNLANAATTGYKRIKPVFEDLLYQTLRAAGGPTGGQSQSPSGLQVGTGVLREIDGARAGHRARLPVHPQAHAGAAAKLVAALVIGDVAARHPSAPSPTLAGGVAHERERHLHGRAPADARPDGPL